MQIKILPNKQPKRPNLGGWSQARYQRHEENYHLHHIKEVVDMLERVVTDKQIEQIILAGDEETILPLTIADELVRRANLLSSARVTFIEDDMRLQQLGGVGGILRYRISEENAVVNADSAAVPRSKALTTQA